LLSVSASGLSESYDYNEHGIRIRKVSNGATTLYPFAHYEVDNGVIVKYYFFGGQRVAMKRGSGALTYLHQDHLGSTALSTTSSGAFDVGQGYRGYGNYRTGGNLPTEHRFTGQKLDIATGLMYYNARYYDRTVGHFVSPDTLVPDPTSVWDYNRLAYGRLNPLKYNDPNGHCSSVAAGAPVMLADMGFCPGGSPSGHRGSGGGAVVLIAGGMTTVVAGYLIGQAAHDLVQDIGGYITPETGPAGSTVHADPLPVTSSAGASFPLADGGPQTSVPPSTGVDNDTLNLLADPLPTQQVGGNIVYSDSDSDYLARLPVRYGNQGPTTGILVVNGQEYSVASGRGGPAASMPQGASGFTGRVREHAEGNAAAIMHQVGATNATLYINNRAGPCQQCRANLSAAVPEGATLRVVWGDMYGTHEETFGR
jgi:RHS repeat-associated protein